MQAVRVSRPYVITNTAAVVINIQIRKWILRVGGGGFVFVALAAPKMRQTPNKE